MRQWHSRTAGQRGGRSAGRVSAASLLGLRGDQGCGHLYPENKPGENCTTPTTEDCHFDDSCEPTLAFDLLRGDGTVTLGSHEADDAVPASWSPTMAFQLASFTGGAATRDGFRSGWVLAGLATALLLSGCGADGSGGATELRLCGDEAARDIPRFTLMREWSVGGAEDRSLSLSYLGWMVAAPGQGLSFAQRGAAPIVTLSADGTVRGQIGRAGSGPGEWSSGAGLHMAWYGDTLMVTEALAWRVHTFLEQGELLESRFLATSTERRGQVLRVLRNGSVLAYTPSLTEPGIQILSRWSERHGRWDSISTRGQFTYRLELGGGRFSERLMPVLDRPLWATAPDGSSVVIVDRTASSSPDSAAYRIRRVGDDGSALLDRSICYLPRPFPHEEREDTIQAKLRPLLDGNRLTRPVPAVERDIRESISLPEFLPPVTRLVVGTDGDIWLRREVLADGFAYWEIRDPDGELTGTLRLPSQRRVGAVDGEIVWISEPDPWEVPIISRTRLVRR